MDYYLLHVNELNSEYYRLSAANYLAGAMSTFVVIIQLDMWSAVFVGVVNALNAYIISMQYEEQLARTNRAQTKLNNARDWWYSLSDGERIKVQSKQKLVMDTENAIEEYVSGWLAAMATEEEEEGDDDKKK